MATISNQTRYYHSGMSGAPALSGAAGALIAVLDACLVDGWDVKTINSLTVSAGIATASISAGHTFVVGDVVRVSGVTPAALNGDWRLAEVTGSSATWSVAGLGISDGAGTGTMLAKRAPAGWAKVFSASNRAAYRSLSYQSHNGLILYVDDSGTTTARVRGYESMSDIDTGSGPFPTDTQLSGGLWWSKATNTTGSRSWAVQADAKRLVFMPRIANQSAKSLCFGLFLDAAGRDLWGTFISGADSSTTALSTSSGASNYGDMVLTPSASTVVAGYIARSRTGAQSVTAYAASPSVSGQSTGATGFTDGALPADIPPLSHVLLGESGLKARGFFPGPCYSNRRFLNTSYPPGTMVGAPGNGAVVEYASSYSSSLAWFVHLGTDGRWD